MLSWWQFLVLAATLSVAPMNAARAQATFARIQDPVPIELRDRLVDLMRTVRPNDANEAVAATKIIDGRLWREFGMLFLRVETNCQYCMTIVSRATDSAIIPELTLIAGSRVRIFHEIFELWGGSVGSIPIEIEGYDGGGTVLFRWNETWVIQGCGTCFLPTETRPKPPSLPPPPKPPEQTFEDFRRALGREP
ncbi:hypothetical protein [Methylobacterium oxalidis]|uniref:hypothetical protein n=1 Tax=Methylobacterium oxalidis TaxID=944322 RepID=UPI0033147BD4